MFATDTIFFVHNVYKILNIIENMKKSPVNQLLCAEDVITVCELLCLLFGYGAPDISRMH